MITTSELSIKTTRSSDPMLKLYSRLHERIQKLIKKGYFWEGNGYFLRVYGKNKIVHISDRVTGGYNDDPFTYNVKISFYRPS